MPTVNWDVFAGLPGAASTNFEMLCRALIRCHYGQFGDFRALTNQPGVEFHLKLHSPCSLGDADRWYGWQCRWYDDLPKDKALGSTRRRKIEEAIAKSEVELPGLTDWVLWTRHTLTKDDQKWFQGLQTHMRLHPWTAAEVEEHLTDHAEIFRSTYFGELVLTPDLLGEMHAAAVAPIKSRWQPDVHQVVDAERSLHRSLGTVEAWSNLRDLAARLRAGVETVISDTSELPEALMHGMNALIGSANVLADLLSQIHTMLEHGDYDILRQQLANRTTPDPTFEVLLRRLRAGRHPVVLPTTNLLSDISATHKTLTTIDRVLTERLIAVVADQGCGKTQLAAQLTAATSDRPAGVLLHGQDLRAGHSLEDFACNIVIHGKPAPSFEAFVAAVDAAGQRAGRRLPIIIDGLNEAEDPRDWKRLLASLIVTLQKYQFVLVVCTLRPDFTKHALPEALTCLEIPGFQYDTVEAVRKYFRHYRIDPADAELPWRLLRHPLTLRMFCEVTNPGREKTVGVEAMPASLTALFERYLEQVAERIMQLSPRACRYYDSDIRTALNRIGFALWEMNTRSVDIAELRRRLGDDARPWDQSIVRALEHDGVLLKVPGDRQSAGHMTVLYDALAGHIVADALLDENGRAGFEAWLDAPKIKAALMGDLGERHPLASDIFRALAGLIPRRMYGRQFWSLLDEPSRTEALHEAAWLDRAHLDSKTVSHLAALVMTSAPNRRRDLFDRLWTTRAARSHPLDAQFLDAALRKMSIADRDLRWTEWVRSKQEEIIKDLKRLERRWQTEQMLDEKDLLRARWVMWTLTSTVHLLRDHATRALYWFGSNDPDALFELTLDALGINDPYVPERMLAACYGVAMSLWADPRGTKVQAALPTFANALVDRMFIPEALHPTMHALMRDYALGVISLASRVAPGCIPKVKLCYLEPPFDHVPFPFAPAADISDSDVAGVDEAIRMDFGNYTIGSLIPDRRNYDSDNPTYKEVRRQIERRIIELGYSPSRFAEVDRLIEEGGWRSESRATPKTERYGKKYSWVAFFEMYGHRLDKGDLPEWRSGERSSDADIDPSFPNPARSWAPTLPDLFTTSPAEHRGWVADGPTPDYQSLLCIKDIDGLHGPWVLLGGYIEQSGKNDVRRVFTFLRGLLVRHKLVGKIFAAFDAIEYPGNMAVPEPQENFYTYAGEIPWSPHFGSVLRGSDGRAKRDIRRALAVHDGKHWLPGIPVEVPAYRFRWESYHSGLNQVSGVMVPAPALCEKLSLSNRQGEWDLYDPMECMASLYREFKADEDTFYSNLLYMRADLMEKYLAQTGQTLIWLAWGERGFKHEASPMLRDESQQLWSKYRHIHRRRFCWEPQAL